MVSIIEPLSVEGENFGSWKRIFHNFKTGTGKTLITGKNGSGKSTFLELAFWVLFGKNTKGLDVSDVVNWHDGKNCYGKLIIKKGKTQYRIERYRDHDVKGSSLFLYKIEKGKEKDISHTKIASTQEEIEKIWGLNYTATICTILLSQAKMSTFLEVEGAKRHELFDSLMRLHLLKPIEKKVRDRHNFMKKEFIRLDKEIFSLEEKLVQLQGIIDDYQKNIEEKRVSLTEERDKIASDLDAVLALPLDILKEYYNLSEQIEEEESNISNENEVIEDEIKELEGKLTSFQNDECPECHTSSCPHCGKHVLQASSRMQEIQDEIAELAKERDDIINQNKETQNKIDELMAKEKKLRTKLKDYIVDDELTISYEDVIRYENQIETLREKLKSADEAISNVGQGIDLDKLNRIQTENTAKLVSYKLEVSVLSEEKRRFTDFWMKVFDKDDDLYIKRILMKNLIVQLNGYINRRLSRFVFDEVTSAEFNEDLKFIVTVQNEDGKKTVVPYAALSGGEQRKLNICVNLALGDLVYLQYSKIAATFMDEISTGLDNASNIALAEMIDELSQEKPVYVISHASVFNNQFDEVLEVERYDDKGKKYSRFKKAS